LAVDVRFRNQGLDTIEVHDNGSGIRPADYELVALKHYTSKLETYDDISSLDTFGFRGEALASICALAELTVTTCRAEDVPKGSRLDFESSGKLKTVTVVAAQRGTTVLVEKLFHNLPVRRRELERNIKREWARMITLLNQYACIQVGVKFQASQQPTKGKRAVLFSTAGNREVKDNVMNVYGARALQSLMTVDVELDLIPTEASGIRPGRLTSRAAAAPKRVRVCGLVSRPAHGEGRQTPDRQMFYVNGRPCALPQFAKVFNEAYRPYNPSQSPFVVADIRLDTNLYDVNVSPDKRTILIHDQGPMLEALREALASLFEEHGYAVHVNVKELDGLSKSSVSAAKRIDKIAGSGLMSSSPSVVLGTQSSVISQFNSDHSLVNDQAHANDESITEGEQILGSKEAEGGEEGEEDGERLVHDIDSGIPGAHLASCASFTSPSLQRATSKASNLSTQKTRSSPPPSLTAEGASNILDVMMHRPRDALVTGTRQSRLMATGANRTLSSPSRFDPRVGTDPDSDECSHYSAVTNHGLRDTDEDHPRKRLKKTPDCQPHAVCMSSSHGRVSSSVEPAVPRISRSLRITLQGPETATAIHVENDNIDERLAEVDETSDDMLSGPTRHTDSSAPQVSETFDQESMAGLQPVSQRRTTENSVLTSEQPLTGTSDDSFAMEPAAHSNIRRPCAGDTTRPPPACSTNLQTRTHTKTKRSTLGLSLNLTTSEVAIRESLARWKQTTEPVTSSQRSPSPSASVHVADVGAGLDVSASAEDRLTLIVSKSDFGRMRIVGQFNLGFILVVKPAANCDSDAMGGELFIIDQHASDEKYNFERLQSQTIVQSQRLVRSKQLNLTALEEEIVMNNMDAIEANGFGIDVTDGTGFYVGPDPGVQVAGSRCRLTALPLSKDTTFTINDLEELIHLLGEQESLGGPVPRPSKVRKMFAMRACRSSIMIGKALTHGQMAKVVRHMGELDKPWNCPHGRPTMRHLAAIRLWDTLCWKEPRAAVPL